MNDISERLIYQVDFDKWAKESWIAHVWSRDASNIHQLKVWILDAQIQKNELVLLVAAVNPNVSAQQVQYALATIQLQRSINQAPPTGFTTFTVLKYAQRLGDHSDEPERCRLILNGPGCGTSGAFLLSDRWILCVPSSSREPVLDTELDKLEVRSAQERFLGGGVLNQRPVFFSSRHGVLVLQPSAGLASGVGGDQSLLDESVLEHSQVMADALESQVESSTSKLKVAFFNFCRKNVFDTRTVLDELFSSPSSKGTVDSLMDRMVVELSQKIIDDYPASDPRWTDSVPAGHESTFTTVSLLVLHQLDDKVKAHDLYLTFLRYYKQKQNPFGLIDRLAVFTFNFKKGQRKQWQCCIYFCVVFTFPPLINIYL